MTDKPDWSGTTNYTQIMKAPVREAEAATAPDVSEAELAEWEALCDKATGGELRGMSEQGRSGLLWTLFTEYTLRVGSFTCREDALFFQQARTALPRLIAALRAARKREGDAVDALESIRDEVLHADANILNNDQVNYVLGIIDSHMAARETAALSEGAKNG